MILAVIDIDGTIADIGPRLKAAGQEPARGDKKEFQAWLDRLQNNESIAADKPIKGMLQLLHAIEGSMQLVYLTGRSDQYRAVTESWLDRHGFPAGPLLMRKGNDWRNASLYKEEMLKKLLKEHSPYTMLTIDDDGSGDCAEMYQRLGCTHLKVMNRWDVK